MDELDAPRPPTTLPLYAKERMSVVLLAAAGMVTVGLVMPGWFILKRSFLNSLGPRAPMTKLWPGLAIGMLFVGNVATLADELARDPKYADQAAFARLIADDLILVGGPLAIVATAIVMKLSYDVASLLEAHRARSGEGAPVSKVLALLLGPIYLQYRVNLLAGPGD